MCPHKFKRGGELPTLANPPRVGPKTLADPQPTRAGKLGGQGGGAPMAGGVGGVPPQIQKRGRVAHLSNPATSGAQNPGRPSANEGGQTGGPGGGVPWRGAWGGSPHKFKRGGELPTLANPPRVGPKTLADPQPTRVGKLGGQGAKPPGRGFGGCAPTNSKEGASSPP